MYDDKKEFKLLVLELIEVPEDEREMELLKKLNIISPDPEFLDYIFQSEEFYKEDGSFDIDSLTEKVFNYKPIQL
jgi:hypothetical protein